MKPTKKQKQFLAAVAKQITDLCETNDLYSPTHYNDIEESARQVCEDFDLDADVDLEVDPLSKTNQFYIDQAISNLLMVSKRVK
jgi:hypothetical protein